MRTSATALTVSGLAVVLGLLACGPEDKRTPPPEGAGGAGGAGGTGGVAITHPIFAGITVSADPVDANSVIVRWAPATDDTTPPEELTYTLYVSDDHPDRPAPGQLIDYDVTGLTEYRYSGMPAEDVRWFFVVVEDAQGEEAGRDQLVPASKPTVAPSLDAPAPALAAVGETVQVIGNHLLDEPISDGALTLGGQPVPREAIVQWANQILTITVPEGAVSGPIQVTTPFGVATSTAELTVQ